MYACLILPFCVSWIRLTDYFQPDYSLPVIPDVDAPILNDRGEYIGTNICLHRYPRSRPDVPYGEQHDDKNALWFEDGFKECIGQMTEGRYLVFEKGGWALSIPRERYNLVTTRAVEEHNIKAQRWVVHYNEDQESHIFTLSSALDGRWLGTRGALVDAEEPWFAEPVRITYRGNGDGYMLQYVNGGQYIDIDELGRLKIAWSKEAPVDGYQIFSVSYHD